MKVTDKVYKVIRDIADDKIIIAEYQILRIMRHGRLICFRLDKKDWAKSQHSFQPADVRLTPEEAIELYSDQMHSNLRIAYNKVDQCLKEISLFNNSIGFDVSP